MCLFIVLNPESTSSEFFLELVEQFLRFLLREDFSTRRIRLVHGELAVAQLLCHK